MFHRNWVDLFFILFSDKSAANEKFCFHSCFGFNVQFNDIGHHGTKVIVFNLWYNDDGDMELDFESDPKVST